MPYVKQPMDYSTLKELKANSGVAHFLIRTFFKASFLFAMFGIVCTTISYLIGQYAANKLFVDGSLSINRGFMLALGVLLIVGLILAWFLQYKWSQKVEQVSSAFVVATFGAYLFSFLIIMVPIITGLSIADLALQKVVTLNSLAVFKTELLKSTLKYGGLLFGLSFLVYFIPASVGFLIQKTKTVQTIAKVVRISALVTLGLFLVVFITSFFAYRSAFASGLNILIMVGMGIVIFLQPILTIYRMRQTIQGINFEDDFQPKRWSNFFALQILVEMLYIMWYIARLLLMFRR